MDNKNNNGNKNIHSQNVFNQTTDNLCIPQNNGFTAKEIFTLGGNNDNNAPDPKEIIKIKREIKIKQEGEEVNNN